MNIRQLKSFIALAETGTFSAAGQRAGLSHAAISQHIKALEQQLGAELVDRTRRPPALTPHGHALLIHGRRMMDVIDDITALGTDESLSGNLDVGVVPSAMIDLLPPALAEIRRAHPKLRLRVRTGPSGELASRVRGGDLDVAITTAPERPVEGLRNRPIWHEPLIVIAPREHRQADAMELLRHQPFIWFSRTTWAGQQIERRLLEMGVVVQETMEVDSLIAVTALVAHGLGISIVPWRANAPSLPASIIAIPFGSPQFTRTLAQIERPGNPKVRLTDTLFSYLQKQAPTTAPAREDRHA